MSLVGSFDDNKDMEAWNPTSAFNLMNPLNPGSFERVVHLTAGQTYNYKYVANRSPWALVYADYDLIVMDMTLQVVFQMQLIRRSVL